MLHILHLLNCTVSFFCERSNSQGNLYILQRCQSNSCVGRMEPPVVILDPLTGSRLAEWGEGLLAFPHGLHIDHNGNIWIADVGRGAAEGGHLVRKFSSDGDLLMTIGQSGVAGDEPGLLREPTDVVTTREGTIFITEGHIKIIFGRRYPIILCNKYADFEFEVR